MRRLSEYCSTALAATALVALGLSGCSSSSDDDPGMVEPPFMAGTERHFSDTEAAARTELLVDDGATEVSRTADGWDVTVGGRSVAFADSDLGANSRFSGAYFKEMGEDEAVFFWSLEPSGFGADVEPEFDYLNVYGFAHSQDFPDAEVNHVASYIFIVDGTPTAEMPVTGSARYEGKVSASEWSSNMAVNSADRTRWRGDFSMDAEFGGSATEVTGEFSNLERRIGGGSYTDVPGSIPFGLEVEGNHLSTSVESIDAGPLAGYENVGIRAAFFGPAAEEVGGVFEGENPTANTLLHGWFAGSQ